jgi:hypothetical protein
MTQGHVNIDVEASAFKLELDITFSATDDRVIQIDFDLSQPGLCGYS